MDDSPPLQSGPGISVIIPTMLRETLPRAIDSAIYASGFEPKADEVLVVVNGCRLEDVIDALGGSPVRSKRVDTVFGKRYPRCVKFLWIPDDGTPPDWGARGRNWGARQRSNDVLMFLDDDDAYTVGAISHARMWAREFPDCFHVGRMEWDGRLVPTPGATAVRVGDVGTPCMVLPVGALGGSPVPTWEPVYEQDGIWARSVEALVARAGGRTVLHPAVIAKVRPA